jgi:hypothetical protein
VRDCCTVVACAWVINLEIKGEMPVKWDSVLMRRADDEREVFSAVGLVSFHISLKLV